MSEVTKTDLLAMVLRLQLAIGDFCCANGISESDLEEGEDDDRALLAAVRAADELLERCKVDE